MQSGSSDRLVSWSLERLAALAGDPADRVYAALFRDRPDLAPLFVLDGDGSVRGNMLANVIEVALDLDGAALYGANMLRAEAVNHAGFGVDRAAFPLLFDSLARVTREALGPEWTPAVAQAWQALLARIDDLLPKEPAP